MIKAGFGIGVGDQCLGDDDDLTPWLELKNFAGCASWTIQDYHYFLGPGGAWVDIRSGLGLETLAPGCERHMPRLHPKWLTTQESRHESHLYVQGNLTNAVLPLFA